MSLLESDDSLEEIQRFVPAMYLMKERNNNNMIVLGLMHPIPFRRLWQNVLLAYGCVHDAVTEATDLSMYSYHSSTLFCQHV